MANSGTTVLLGFDDEPITEKHKGQLNFALNKIGGLPDCPSNLKLDPPKCPLCQLPRLLIVQIYAPLDNPVFHRTLYLFACINPNCWNSNESWLCVRVQSEEKLTVEESLEMGPPNDWCVDADDWGDEEDNVDLNEENGNVVRVSDDEESCSPEDSLRSGFAGLTTDDDKNANLGAQGGAVGRLHSPTARATAEIEGNEGEAISIDTPTLPQRDIDALLQEVAPLPREMCQRSPYFVPYFMSVYEETTDKQVNDRHVKELLQEYQQRNHQLEYQQCKSDDAPPKGAEGYEKSDPAHGDKMFHSFLSRVQANRGQILRYSRESSPLLLRRLQELPRCPSCRGETVFEFQLVPTIISKLRLVTDPKPCNRLEFGTVLVYTCRRSCWSTATADDAPLRIESVIVQAENL